MTITEQALEAAPAGTITAQLVDLSWKDAWLHEPRGPHGEWVKTGVADLTVHRDGTVTSKKTRAELGGLAHEDGKWTATHGDGTVSRHATRPAALKAMVSRHNKAGQSGTAKAAAAPPAPGAAPEGIPSGSHPADRAAVPGKLGQESRAHAAVAAERQRRKTAAAPARKAGKPPATAAAGPAGNDAKAFAAAIKSGVASRKAPGSAKVLGSQGEQGGTEIVTFGNGAQYVHKDFKGTILPYPESMGGPRPMPLKEKKLQVAKESMAAKVSDVIGAGAPAILRDPHSPTGFYEPKVAGVSAMEYFSGGKRDPAKMYDSPEGMKIGLMDALIGADDRHLGNVMITPDGKPVPIDHNDTWVTGQRLLTRSPFEVALGKRIKAGKSPFSTADLDQVKEKIEALRPEFEAMPGGEGARYYQMTMSKLAQIRGQVAGR